MVMSSPALRNFNFHHLYYFYRVASLRSFTKAAKELRVSQPAVSAQVKTLETLLENQLVVRGQKEVMLTEVGTHVFAYAEQIFRAGAELLDSLAGGNVAAKPLRIGILDVVPKVIVHRMVADSLESPGNPCIICIEGSTEHLLGALAAHEVDLILTDKISTSNIPFKAYHHELGESGTSFFARKADAARFRKGFPHSLDGAPLLVPTEHAAIRPVLDAWLRRKKIFPKIVGEFQDSAMMKMFGGAGLGIFIAPTVVEQRVRSDFGVELIGRVPELKERFFLISIERKLSHPGVVRIFEKAHRVLHGTHR